MAITLINRIFGTYRPEDLEGKFSPNEIDELSPRQMKDFAIALNPEQALKIKEFYRVAMESGFSESYRVTFKFKYLQKCMKK